MVIDAHMHIWGKIDGLIAKKHKVVPLGNGMIRIGEKAMLGMPASFVDCSSPPETILSEFDAAGVDAGVVVQEYMDGEQNDYLLAAKQKNPDRWIIHGLPNYWNTDTLLDESRALLDRGFDGIKLAAGHFPANNVALDNPKFMAVYEEVAKRDRVLAVDLSEGEIQVPAMENVLKRLPDLRVSIGHFGMCNRGGFPGQLLLCRHKNVYMESGGIVWLYRHEGYPFPGAIDIINHAKKEVGIEKLMWGSDYPRTMVDFTFRQSIDFVRISNELSDYDKRFFLGESAARLYKLQPPKSPRMPVTVVTANV